MDDNSLMTFGKYQGQKMANVPAGYLLFLKKSGKVTPQVLEYIEENYDDLVHESKKELLKRK